MSALHWHVSADGLAVYCGGVLLARIAPQMRQRAYIAVALIDAALMQDSGRGVVEGEQLPWPVKGSSGGINWGVTVEGLALFSDAGGFVARIAAGADEKMRLAQDLFDGVTAQGVSDGR